MFLKTVSVVGISFIYIIHLIYYFMIEHLRTYRKTFASQPLWHHRQHLISETDHRSADHPGSPCSGCLCRVCSGPQVTDQFNVHVSLESSFWVWVWIRNWMLVLQWFSFQLYSWLFMFIAGLVKTLNKILHLKLPYGLKTPCKNNSLSKNTYINLLIS